MRKLTVFLLSIVLLLGLSGNLFAQGQVIGPWIGTSPILTTPELIGEYYDVVTQSPSTTRTVTINPSTTGKAIITPTTASQADTIAFSPLSSTGKVRYMRVQIVAPASGTQTIVWPTSNFYWIGGVSGQLTALTATKHYEYSCEIESTNIFCSILSEGAY